MVSEKMKRVNKIVSFDELPKTKTFNGKRFLKGGEFFSNKTSAQKSAKSIRSAGWSARVVQGNVRGVYAIYVDPKPTKRKAKLQRSKNVRARSKSAKRNRR